jgi:NADPH:quinone reductase
LTIEELPDPQPGLAEVLIEVKACNVNYPDTLMVEDRYQFKPERPFSPGGEVAGVVSAVRKALSQFRTGDHVIDWCNWGGSARPTTRSTSAGS